MLIKSPNVHLKVQGEHCVSYKITALKYYYFFGTDGEA